MKTLIIYCTLFFGLWSANNPQLVINIENIESIQGDIIIGIYNTEKGFLEAGTEIKHYKLTVVKNTERLVINDLPAGSYAISMFHDENSDGICNKNFMGIPKEPYGFSNNFKPKFSAPKFEDCKFSFSKNHEIQIRLVN